MKPEAKVCKDCNESQPIKEFSQLDETRWTSVCHKCQYLRIKKKDLADPEYRERRLRQKRETSARKHAKEPEHTRRLSNESYQRCKEKRIANAARWKKANRAKINAQVAANRKKDPEATRLKEKEKREKESYIKLRSTPQYVIATRLRSRIYHMLKKKSATKANRTLDLIGCDLETLMQHLELQFQDGMTWDNKHLWAVDHIIPCAEFDLQDPEEQKKCFHYTNLQPLWNKDNLRKSDKLEVFVEIDENYIDTVLNLCDTSLDDQLEQSNAPQGDTYDYTVDNILA